MSATATDVRAIALALPQVEERDHMGSASFRVAEKIFAQLSADKTSALVKMPLPDQTARVLAEPERFRLPEHWGKYGWTFVRLTGTRVDEIRELLESSWLAIAPKKLAARHREEHAARVQSGEGGARSAP